MRPADRRAGLPRAGGRGQRGPLTSQVNGTLTSGLTLARVPTLMLFLHEPGRPARSVDRRGRTATQPVRRSSSARLAPCSWASARALPPRVFAERAADSGRRGDRVLGALRAPFTRSPQAVPAKLCHIAWSAAVLEQERGRALAPRKSGPGTRRIVAGLQSTSSAPGFANPAQFAECSRATSTCVLLPPSESKYEPRRGGSRSISRRSRSRRLHSLFERSSSTIGLRGAHGGRGGASLYGRALQRARDRDAAGADGGQHRDRVGPVRCASDH